MATGKRGGGPGTYTDNGVICTMHPPFGQAASQKQGVGGGRYGSNKAPFDKGQSMGGGSIPTKFFDGMSANEATTSNAGASSVIGITKRNPSERRFKNAK